MWIAALAFLSKLLDLVNPWSSYWAGKAKTRDEKKDAGEKKRNEAAKKGDFDEFLEGRSDDLSA